MLFRPVSLLSPTDSPRCDPALDTCHLQLQLFESKCIAVNCQKHTDALWLQSKSTKYKLLRLYDTSSWASFAQGKDPDRIQVALGTYDATRWQPDDLLLTMQLAKRVLGFIRTGKSS